MAEKQVLEGSVETTDGVDIHRGYVESFDGIKLHYLRWTDDSAEAGDAPVVVIMHGFGEHIERYHELATALVRAGMVVVGHDARGHGRSDGTRSFVERFEDYAHDLKLMFNLVKSRYPSRPRVLVGHSNGGLISVRFLQMHPGFADYVVLSAPLLGLALPVPWWKSAAGKVLTHVIPSLQMANEIDPSHVSRTPEIVEAYANDPLVNKTATPRYFTEMLGAIEKAWDKVGDLKMPIICFQGFGDKMVDAKAVERFFERVPASDKTFVPLAEHYHEIFNEPDRAERYDEVVAWINDHL